MKGWVRKSLRAFPVLNHWIWSKCLLERKPVRVGSFHWNLSFRLWKSKQQQGLMPRKLENGKGLIAKLRLLQLPAPNSSTCHFHLQSNWKQCASSLRHMTAVFQKTLNDSTNLECLQREGHSLEFCRTHRAHSVKQQPPTPSQVWCSICEEEIE